MHGPPTPTSNSWHPHNSNDDVLTWDSDPESQDSASRAAPKRANSVDGSRGTDLLGSTDVEPYPGFLISSMPDDLDYSSVTRAPSAGAANTRPPGCAADAVKLFVGNIPKSYAESQLLPFFETVGKVVDLVVVRDRVTRESKGSAFLWYVTRAHAEQAIQQLNMRFILPDPSGKQTRPLAIRKARVTPRAAPAGPGPGPGASRPSSMDSHMLSMSGGPGGGGGGSYPGGPDHHDMGIHGMPMGLGLMSGMSPTHQGSGGGHPHHHHRGGGGGGGGLNMITGMVDSLQIQGDGGQGQSQSRMLDTLVQALSGVNLNPGLNSNLNSSLSGGRGAQREREQQAAAAERSAREMFAGGGPPPPYGGGGEWGGGYGGGSAATATAGPGSGGYGADPVEQVSLSLQLNRQQLMAVSDHLHSVRSLAGTQLLFAPAQLPGLFDLSIRGSAAQVNTARIMLSSLLGNSA